MTDPLIHDDSYIAGIDVIIPPPSILDGTAPYGLFMEYVNTTDITRLRVCDVVRVWHWYARLLEAIPKEMREEIVRGESQEKEWPSL